MINMELVKDGNGDPEVLVTTAAKLLRFPIKTGAGIHKCNEFLRSHNPGVHVEFQSYAQYADLIETCNERSSSLPLSEDFIDARDHEVEIWNDYVDTFKPSPCAIASLHALVNAAKRLAMEEVDEQKRLTGQK
jgi:hypothetical protein